MTISGNDELGELLSAYLDGELSEQETALVEGHVLQDQAAIRLLEELRRNAELVGSLPRHKAPPGVCEDLKGHLERQELLGTDDPSLEVVDHERRSWFAWLSMAAMIALVAVSGVWMLRSISTTKTNEPQQPSVHLAEAAGLTADDKLARGASIESLRRHSFDAEPVRIRMVLKDSDRLDALAKKLVTSFASHRAVSLQELFTGERRDRARSKGFFYEGSRGKNFAGANSRQLLVRVPISALDSLLRDLGRGKQGIESVELAAGQLVYRGVRNIRSTLRLIDGQSDTSGGAANGSKGRRSRKESAAISAPLSNMQVSPAKEFSFLRELSIALGETRGLEASKRMARAEGARGARGRVADASIEQSARAESKASRARTKFAKMKRMVSPVEAPAELDLVAASVSESGPASEPATAAAGPRFVTLVVELRPKEPARKPAGGKTTSTPKAKANGDSTRKNGSDKPIQ